MKELKTPFCQHGLGYFPAYAVYASFQVKDRSVATHGLWQRIAAEVDAFCKATGYRTVVILGLGLEIWAAWSAPRRPRSMLRLVMDLPAETT